MKSNQLNYTRIRINSTPLLCIAPYKRVTTCTGGSSCMGSVQEVLYIPRRPLVFFLNSILVIFHSEFHIFAVSDIVMSTQTSTPVTMTIPPLQNSWNKSIYEYIPKDSG